MDASWYARRLLAMSPAEVGHRVRQQLVKQRWRRSWRAAAPAPPATPREVRPFAGSLPAPNALDVDPLRLKALVAHADEIVAGSFELFGVARDDLVRPDWFLDPVTGRRAPADECAFAVAYRDEDRVGTIKQIWELSRHHHLTVLAAAYWYTGEEVYARRTAEHLTSWWAENPFLSGVHWTSGIELGIRLISWTWVRRLLDGWPMVTELFDDNPVFWQQLADHQRYLAALVSTGSSANNHVVAEAAGQLVAANAFPWFERSERWAADALDLLTAEIASQTFPSGLNRELATDYHGLVLELALVAAAELTLVGQPVPAGLARPIVRMTDALAAIVDVSVHPPRQGDGDDGLGLVVDGPGWSRWASLLVTGQAAFGGLHWWPGLPAPDVRAGLLAAALAGHLEPSADRPGERPALFGDAGMVIVRGESSAGEEIWCRGDVGPHGFLSIAAHAHADALSVELRVAGTDVLADPGTFCYHGEPEWRAYFRGTRGHSTLELDGRDQSTSGGPFLWTRHADARLVAHSGLEAGAVARWTADHDGYSRRGAPLRHARTVELDRTAGRLVVIDRVLGAGRHAGRLSFHLGPEVDCHLEGTVARLRWPAQAAEATFELDPALAWTLHCGEDDPPEGWYSPGFGRKVPAFTLVGRGQIGTGQPLRCVLAL
jgi:hypothetical protein